MRAEIHAEGTVRGADLGEDAREDLGARTKAAVLLGDAEAHEAQLRHPLPNAIRELALVIVFPSIHGLCRP